MPTPPDKQPHARRGREVASNPDLLPTASDIARFNQKIVYSPRCWFWTGAISTPDGYGRFTFQRDNQQRTILAHRFALLATGIDLAEGDVAEHACNEPLCVRVHSDHVHPSTQVENLRYAVRRGRHSDNTNGVHSKHRAKRSQSIRAALQYGWNPEAFHRAINERPDNQPPLF